MCDIESERMEKYHEAGTITYRFKHRLKRSYAVVVHGVLQHGKCYTGALIPRPLDDESGEGGEIPKPLNSVKTAISSFNAISSSFDSLDFVTILMANELLDWR